MRNRIFFAVFFLQFLLAVPPQQAESRFERAAREKQAASQKIAWPNHEPVAFYLRRGRHAEDWIEAYERQHAPENVRLMAKAGVRYGRLHFYKGFGLNLEMPEIEKSRKMSELMHQLGMKVSVYVAGTMFVESFYREVPEAAKWEQRDQWDRPVYYSDTQTYRHFACPNEPAYRGYIKKVLKIAVESIKADQIFFDNFFLQPEPKSCRCPRCRKGFTEFLRRRYPTREAAFRRFGYPDADYVQVNEWDVFNRPEDLVTVDDPVLQEWTRFRAESLTRHCAELYDYIKGLNPNISVGFNLKGIYGLNRIWRNAVYHPLFQGKIDFSPFDVGGMEARLDARTGALVSEIRSYKMARTLGFSYETGGGPLEFALFMAFNPQKQIQGYGYQGGPWNTRGVERSFSAEAEFFREYSDRYFTETENVADVAVVRTWASMAHSIVATLVPAILMEQVLIQHKVPFDLLFDEQMDRIDRYRAVVLAGQEALSGAWVDKLAAYVRNGGTLVFTGNTGHYNEWREMRTANPLLALMGGKRLSAVTVQAVGKGKLVYIPDLTLRAKGQAAEARRIGIAGDETSLAVSGPVRSGSFPAADWVLPENHAAVHRAVTGNLREPVSVTAGAPLTTVMEVLNRPKTGETILHFVNFDSKTAQAGFPVRLRAQFAGRKVASVNAFCPELDQPRKLEFAEQGGEVTFTVPPVKVYSMVVVSHR
jgi:hypothetical protein